MQEPTNNDEQPQLMRLTITLDPKTGRLQVDGPIDNEALCDWMMKKAGRQIEARLNQMAMAAQSRPSILPHSAQQMRQVLQSNGA